MQANITMKVNRRIKDPVVFVSDTHPSIELDDENKERLGILCRTLENAFLSYLYYDTIDPLWAYLYIFMSAEDDDTIHNILNQGKIDIIVEGNFLPDELIRRLRDGGFFYNHDIKKTIAYLRCKHSSEEGMTQGYTVSALPTSKVNEEELENLDEEYIEAFDIRVEYVRGFDT